VEKRNTSEVHPETGDLVEIYSKKGYANGYSVNHSFSFSSKFFSVRDGEIGVFICRLSDEPTSILYQYGKVFFHKSGGMTGAILISNLRVLFTKSNSEE
jgi:hypothetical protein